VTKGLVRASGGRSRLVGQGFDLMQWVVENRAALLRVKPREVKKRPEPAVGIRPAQPPRKGPPVGAQVWAGGSHD
jgi:hypothetical protein